MSLQIEEKKMYAHTAADVMDAARKAMTGLEGTIKKDDGDGGLLASQIPKTIHGKVVGDRTWIEVACRPAGDGETELALTAYPLNAIGQKLEFGARKGVLPTVVSWFYAHLDHHLKNSGA